ncbi:unnamed protein product, partial [Vitis vinifera]
MFFKVYFVCTLLRLPLVTFNTYFSHLPIKFFFFFQKTACVFLFFECQTCFYDFDKHKKLTLTNKINIKKLTLSCNIKFRKQNLMQLKRNKKIR